MLRPTGKSTVFPRMAMDVYRPKEWQSVAKRSMFYANKFLREMQDFLY